MLSCRLGEAEAPVRVEPLAADPQCSADSRGNERVRWGNERRAWCWGPGPARPVQAAVGQGAAPRPANKCRHARRESPLLQGVDGAGRSSGTERVTPLARSGV